MPIIPAFPPMAKSYNQQFQVSDLYTNRGQLNFKLNFKNGKNDFIDLH